MDIYHQGLSNFTHMDKRHKENATMQDERPPGLDQPRNHNLEGLLSRQTTENSDLCQRQLTLQGFGV